MTFEPLSMRRLIARFLGRRRADGPRRTDGTVPAAPTRPAPTHDGPKALEAGQQTQLLRNRPSCPACGSVRTAILTVLRPEPPGHWTAERRCRACGHHWEEAPAGEPTQAAF
jgi:hypothetical protein